MESLFSNSVVQGSVAIIAVILILDRVVLLVKYARNGINERVTAKNPTREIFVSQPMREALQEMFKTQRAMQKSIEDSNKIHKEGMGAMTNSLKELVKETRGMTKEISEIKGKVG